ncbi:putative modified peptide [Stenotrophomonas sp. S48]|uniref:NHLP-related RiPP peptide n=1 Tax=unclassified Stenotrophomonas TaxID=196198 RepID=UPI0019021124|nr:MULTISPECIES: NHLP-related RiPP peptide [unclassified Stenotrophomonas]MBK0025129.1 putative modified peptide [Stenotrophomonas sp. S48]MBK0046830.1 putative modified peptide [Stenotrophomonas sp. S49]
MSLPALEADVVRRLIDRLSHDDLFRAQFVRDPGGALVQVGFNAARNPDDWKALSMCFLVGELAPKESILAARDEIHALLTSAINQIVPALDANPGRAPVLKPWSSRTRAA